MADLKGLISKIISKSVDFLILWGLVLVGTGVMTVFLFAIYDFYMTGGASVYAVTESNSNSEIGKFCIGSIFVPIFVAFSGIAIASRLNSKK